jgi:hypothetical protein
MCGRSTAFRRSMVSTIATNKTFRVGLQIPDKSMKALKLLPHTNMEVPNQLNLKPMFGVATSVDPPPSTNKLVIVAYIDLKPFKLSEFQALSKLSDKQHWYTAVNARGRICGIPPPLGRPLTSNLTWDPRGLSLILTRRSWTRGTSCWQH